MAIAWRDGMIHQSLTDRCCKLKDSLDIADISGLQRAGESLATDLPLSQMRSVAPPNALDK